MGFRSKKDPSSALLWMSWSSSSMLELSSKILITPIPRSPLISVNLSEIAPFILPTSSLSSYPPQHLIIPPPSHLQPTSHGYMAVPAVVTTGARRVLRRKDVLQLAVSNHTGTGSGSVLPQRHRFRFGLPTHKRKNTEKQWVRIRKGGGGMEMLSIFKNPTSSDIYKLIKTLVSWSSLIQLVNHWSIHFWLDFEERWSSLDCRSE